MGMKKEKLTPDEAREAFKCDPPKARRKPKPGATREIVCAICGKKFVVQRLGTGRMKYCAECAGTAKAEKNRESALKLKSERADLREANEKRKAARASKIDNLAAAARAAGTSYGRYVAMLEAKKKA